MNVEKKEKKEMCQKNTQCKKKGYKKEHKTRRLDVAQQTYKHTQER